MYFHGYWNFSVTLEDLKQQADEFGLEGKDRTKFLKEELRKIQDAKLEKERFESDKRRLEKEAEQKRFEAEATENPLQREMEEKRLERKLEAKLHSEKLAAQLELESLQLERAKVERENIEALAEVQSTASSQAD